MKVILLEDIKSLGKKDDVIDVGDGYARNYLMPKKKCMEATSKNLNDLKLRKANEYRQTKQLLDAAKEYATALEEKSVTIKMNAGEGGKLFGSVSSKEIAIAYVNQHGLEVDKKKITLREPIKSFGTYKVPVRLHQAVSAELTINVIQE